MFKFFPQRRFKSLSKKKSHYPGAPQEKAPEGEIIKRPPEPGIFGSRPFMTRSRFERKVKKDIGKVPGMGSYSRKEREKILEEDFSKEEIGSYVMPYELTRKIKEFKKRLHQRTAPGEKVKIRKKIKYIEKLRGTQNEH